MPSRTGRRRIESDPEPVYALGSDPQERQRLQRQADELAALSSELLDHTRLGAGDSAIDLGCGPRGVLDLLAARVGPAGRVGALISTRPTSRSPRRSPSNAACRMCR